MKKILALTGLVTVVLTGCRHNPDWHYDCDRYYSENVAMKAECEARVAQMKTVQQQKMGQQSGSVGLHPDIAGPRSDEEIGHRTDDDL